MTETTPSRSKNLASRAEAMQTRFKPRRAKILPPPGAAGTYLDCESGELPLVRPTIALVTVPNA
jgi:hypothetical protein